MKSFGQRGADLTIFSAKYFGGPNTGGIICGRADLVDAVAKIDFTRFESGKYLPLGRAFKLDRQLVVGVTVALQEWLEMDHGFRLAQYEKLVEVIAAHVRDLPGDPAILVHLMDGVLVADVECVSEAEATAIGEALREAIQAELP
jgi:seryl-tRNA(Sec) selenium transferase